MSTNLPIRVVSLVEMLEAMGEQSDDETFRYYQTSYVGTQGWHIPGETLRLTFGEVRKAIR